MKFQKTHGLGNDFIIVNCMETGEFNYSSASRILCRPRWAIGADGLIVLLPSEKADFRMRIFNSDGSEAEMCGNGIRCLGRYIYDHHLVSDVNFTIETEAGVKSLSCIPDERNYVSFVWVNMGKPVFERKKIPMIGEESRAIDCTLYVADKEIKVNCLSVGNPHCVVFVEDWNTLPVETFGPLLENHPAFPRKINVEFVKVMTRDKIRMKVWERGVGITEACGTGACAAGVMSMVKGYVERNISVDLPGGVLQIRWDDEDFIHMGGEVSVVYDGELSVETFEKIGKLEIT